MAVKLSDLIPTGPWTLYFHQADAEKWTLDTFQKVHTCTTYEDVLGVIEEIGQVRFKNGLPFFMRGDILPLWENHQNIRGGSYSMKVPSDMVKDVFTTQVLHAMTGAIFTHSENQCMGVSMSPKKGTFNILKIWNANAEKYDSIEGLKFIDSRCSESEVLYTPHVQKRM
jgi:Eukaryotic initiation factor 4E